jgi:hypothetical protein
MNRTDYVKADFSTPSIRDSGRNDGASGAGDLDAAGAEVGVVGGGADGGPVVPAALAFFVGAFLG